MCIGSIVTHYKWVKWFINTVKKHQPLAKVVVGNSVGGSIPEVLFQTTKVDVVIYGEAEISTKELFDAIYIDINIKLYGFNRKEYNTSVS